MPSWHYTEDPAHSPAAAAAGSSTISLRHALSVCYDIKTPKAQQLLQLLLGQLQQQLQQGKPQPAAGKGVRVSIDVRADASAATDLAAAVQQPDGHEKQPGGAAAAAAAVQRVQALLCDAAGLEAYLAARHVVDVLQDFGEVQLHLAQVSSTGT